MILLTSPPDSFEHFIDSLLQRCTTIILEEVQSALFSKKGQKKSQEDKLAQNMVEGLVIQGRDK